MLKTVIATVTKKITPRTIAKFRSFLISETTVFSPNMYDIISEVTKRRIALIASRILRSEIVKGGSSIFTLLPYDTL